MENRICIDSDVLIDFLRNKPDAVKWVKEYERVAVLATTLVNLFELYYGAYKSTRKDNLHSTNRLAERLQLIPISHESVKVAGQQCAKLEKEGTPVDFRDILIGTAAIIDGFALKTNNKKHFLKIEGIVLV